MRKLIIVTLASATFGGTIGALATAAVQSQASPAAIAAAVQKVQDANAEHSLTGIKTTLSTIDGALGTIDSDVKTLPSPLSAALNSLDQNLFNICLNTEGTPYRACALP